MKRPLPKPPKAYKDLEFLNSPEARPLRMLAEFLEPQRRFRRAGIRDTIVFFGSARILPPAGARTVLRKARAALRGVKRPGAAAQAGVEAATVGLEMSRYYDDTVELARLLTEWSAGLPQKGRFVVCSGGGPGIMEAANRGAHLAGGRSMGLNISLPFEQFANPFISPDLNLEFHYFFMRKFWFIYLAKALVVFPGGFGTLDELMEVLTLLQTDKIRKQMTVVIYGTSYWRSILNFDELVRLGMISASDMKLFRFADTPQEAFQHLRRSLARHYPS